MEAGVRINTPRDEPTETDMDEEMKQLIVTMMKSFQGDIAPFSPPPFGPIAKRVAEALGE
jgi:hypothetical protein